MAEGLIIVESPAKARTLKRFLGDRFDVRASMGHVRDLPERELAVDVEHDFRPSYRVVGDRQETINALKKAVKNRNDVILASDPDREGEAIAWHLSEVLHLRDPKRIEFHEITSDAVRRALDQPRGIDMRLVNAQQARRVVDRLVGYRLSPFLWSKVQKGIGAGRVQSVALRLVVDREEEIRAFQAVESWTVDAVLSRPGDTQRFKARLARRLSDPEAKLELRTQEEAEAAIRELEGASYRVTSIESKQRTKNAPFPYITSTLQQDASSRLRFSPKRTMRLAQDLYEGVELGDEGATGLITYMRTDSARVSDEADKRARGWIGSTLGEKYLGPRRQEKARPGAQDAHEAIRPTDPSRRPEDVRRHLSEDQARLYELIWRRFMASRMAPARYAGTTVEVAGGPFGLRATGSVLVFDGFYRIWERDEKEDDQGLPELREGQDLDFHGLEPEQHFTQPPPRYSEATLINELEKRGIGRPSTYASIVGTIQDHKYVEQRERRLHPTALGEAVNRIMVDHFNDIVDDRYTAAMESRLDEVEQGRVEWVPVVGDFYHPLEKMLSAAAVAMPAETGEECPECHEGQLVLKASRYGPFKGCSRYPQCRYRQAILPSGEQVEPKLLEDACPECGRPLQVRKGRYGEFVGCSGYPECKYIRKDASQSASTPTGQACPECGQGQLMERTGRYGPFLSCSRYPDCRYRANKAKDGRPKSEAKTLDEACPVCGKPMVERRGRYGPFKSCSDYPRCKGPQRAGGRQKARV
ncbi:MAG: type I DNA topoisomerase [Candidatus Nephthysia bennettiae]|uniref:DNA topoisomerase 1 n=1 Tax=Candidatus Nephthysia bennettiae TaxID=3127016 RepID=A0A934NFR2_9BACT|nr:type I DNA topoisomerase [Candidatus Dormibacteraeota bacterium]MBJ7611140.1 type I DNA topoisomerase [Candidatus Dormibacteraeota bacterium]PZR90654.1 MAG: type I DNA topoisomerase [Candidatus Dormibacteraeota bacterium]